MRAIGFKNFRRFQNMEPLHLGGVNFFVGGNNAGKSTVVKAMLLVANFLKNARFIDFTLRFDFDIHGKYEVNIDSFKNALCRDAADGVITFNVLLGDFEITISIFDARPSDGTQPLTEITSADIKNIVVYNSVIGLGFDIDIQSNQVTLASEMSLSNIDIKYWQYRENIISGEIYNIQNDPQRAGSFEEIAKLNKELQDVQKTIKQLSVEDAIAHTIPSKFNHGNSVLSNIIGSFIDVYNGDFPTTDKRSKAYRDYNEEQKLLKDRIPEIAFIHQFIAELDNLIDNLNIEYLPAHAASQQFIFNKNDGNDYVAQSIHEFCNLRIVKETKEYDEYLVSWLNQFDIADDITIEYIGGGAYKCKLIMNGKSSDLADMGRGTIQLVVLFIRLASIMKKYKGSSVIVLIEEPEQNLHPVVQSNLTNLFVSISETCNIRFITETHSEYMIRQTQLVFAKAIKEQGASITFLNDELKVYFFPSIGTPYSMVFQNNGKFEEPFKDRGFFDEAGRINREITILERK